MLKDIVVLAHGAGGKENEQLIKQLFSRLKLLKVTNGIGFNAFDDGAVIPITQNNIVTSIDSYTVDPIFFPGGNIGKLAATGSINDVAVMGADPIAALDSIVVEEGFPISDLKKIVNSMIEIFEQENTAVIGGDLKVMPKGKLDKIVISTVVIGKLVNKTPYLDSRVKPGDKIIVSGTIGDHGAVITALQMGIEAEIGDLTSDCQPVTGVMRIVRKFEGVHAAKDPTRGGLAMSLNEFASKSNVTIEIDEELVPVRSEVKALSEMLGIDPLILACEGRVVLSADAEIADEIVRALRRNGYRDASIIGYARDDKDWNGLVLLRTVSGGLRILDKPTGEITPRIC